MKLFLPFWTTKSIDVNGDLLLFNWRNNGHVSFFDRAHFGYKFADNNEINISEDAITHDEAEDLNWLLANNFLTTEHVSQYIYKEKYRFNPDTLHLILLPAGEACNLDCIYCYENHDDKSVMTETHANTLLKFIKNQGKKNLSIEYFGGEPLLNLKFIVSMANLLNKNNVLFKASITTNGTLLNKETLTKLYMSNVKSFQITLDGPKDIHNNLRRSKSKNLDSFESVIKALKLLANSTFQDISIIVRLNVNHDSIEPDSFSKFVEVIESIIPKNDKRFLILTKLIADYASANLVEKPEAEVIYCKSNQISQVKEKFSNYIDKQYISADSALLMKKGGLTCYAGNADSFVITPDFLVRKCTVALDDKINIVGSINHTGELSLNDNIHLWIKDWSNDGCKSCFAQNTCQGNSCPLENIHRNQKSCPPIKNNVSALTYKVVKTHEKFSDN